LITVPASTSLGCLLDLVEVVVGHHAVHRELPSAPELDEPRQELGRDALPLHNAANDAAAGEDRVDVERHLGAEGRRADDAAHAGRREAVDGRAKHLRHPRRLEGELDARRR